VFNVFAIRGEEYRDPRVLIPGIDHIISWTPSYMVATHGPALAGKEIICEKATRYRDSLQYMCDQSVRAINKGWTMDEMSSRISLPALYDDDYLTSERYGVVEHHLRQIFIGLRGWFDGEESHLFPVEPLERYGKLIGGFGGREAVAQQADAALKANDVRWATELATWLARSEEATDTDRKFLASCLRVIAERTPAANIRNWAITRARHLDGSMPMGRFMRHTFSSGVLRTTPSAELIATLRVLIEPSAIEGMNHHIAFRIDDAVCGLHVRNGVAVPTTGDNSNSTVVMSEKTLHAMLKGSALWSDLVGDGSVSITGDVGAIDKFRKAIENKGFSS
jgi:alkyl sulfatase BDS1-like metallo-beta-lactamase superfamily hydrolase